MGSLSYFLIGLAHVVIGSLMPELLQHYGLHYRDSGTLIFSQFLGFLLGVLIAPRFMARLGTRRTLLASVAILCAAETVYTLLPAWHWMLATGAVAGAGFGAIEAIIGAFIVGSVHDGKAGAMSRVEVFFGVGALLMPVIAGWWRASFAFVAITAACTAAGWAFLSFGRLDVRLRSPEAAGVSTAREKQKVRFAGPERFDFAIFILFFLTYVGLEMSWANFLPSILIERFALGKPAASFGVTLFWLAMALGRLVAGSLSERAATASMYWPAAGAPSSS